ncbi:MAG: GNAT family N-acetyltransferase [Clostridia bacterium]|nr:GNAT family N-acetyltransferase [Clostridia bacterium]
MLQQAKVYFEKNKRLFIDMQECVDKGNAELLYAGADGVLLFDKPSRIMMFAADNKASALAILGRFPLRSIGEKHPFIVAHGEETRLAVEESFGIERQTACYQVVYEKSEPIALKGALNFKKAGKEELPIIQREYALESPENLERLCAQGKIYCAFLPQEQGGAFVGFIGRHPEGSMGLLLIFPEYRRRGYAEELEGYMTNVILSEGRVPYAHIIEDNYKSVNLQKKLGFSVADEKVYWLRLKTTI